MDPEVVGRFLVTAFFAVVFLQSALDKLVDSAGNLEFLHGHFKNSPFSPAMVTRMFWVLTGLEALAGILCALAIVFFRFMRPGPNLGSLGLTFAGLALLALIIGQRFAKDYAGAAVVAAYFAVNLLGLIFYA
jgi:hypothetical protein